MMIPQTNGTRTAQLKRPGFAGSFYDLTVGVRYMPHPSLQIRPEIRCDCFDGLAYGRWFGFDQPARIDRDRAAAPRGNTCPLWLYPRVARSENGGKACSQSHPLRFLLRACHSFHPASYSPSSSAMSFSLILPRSRDSPGLTCVIGSVAYVTRSYLCLSR